MHWRPMSEPGQEVLEKELWALTKEREIYRDKQTKVISLSPDSGGSILHWEQKKTSWAAQTYPCRVCL